MTNPVKIYGVVPVVSTPLTRDGAIDEAGLVRLVEFVCSHEIGGLWALGTGGEDMNLTFAKRLQVARIIAETARQRVPVIMGAGFFCLEESLQFMQEIARLPIAGIHVMPYHPLFSLDRLEWFYRTLADAAPKPLWMYTSANWCRAVPPEFVPRLKGHPNIAGIKWSTANAVHNGKVIAMADDRFQVITAVAQQYHACLAMGSQAHTSSLGSPLPEAMIRIWKAFTAGDMAGSLAAQRRLNAFLDDLPKGPGQDNFLKAAEEKYLLKLRGICDEHVTTYYRPVNEEEQRQIQQAVAKHQPF